MGQLAGKPPHDGQHGSCHIHGAEQIRVQQPLRVGVFRELHGPGDTEAGVVHQDVDGPGLFGDPVHGGPDGALVRDVHGQSFGPGGADPPAAEGIDPAAAFQQGLTDSGADTAAAAGDHGDLTGSLRAHGR